MSDREYRGEFLLWQIGWEDEKRTVKFDEPCHCVACESCGVPDAPSGIDPIVMAFAPVNAPDEVEHRFMTVFGPGWYCRDAKPSDIEMARQRAEEAKRGERDHFAPGEMKTVSLGVPLSEFVDMVFSPTAWAAKRGAELGKKIAEERAQHPATCAVHRRGAAASAFGYKMPACDCGRVKR